MIPQKFEDHKLLKAADLTMKDLERMRGLMILPTKEGAKYTKTMRTIHEGGHSEAYFAEMDGAMERVFREGEKAAWSKKQFQDAVQKIIDDERELLFEGARQLNKNAR